MTVSQSPLPVPADPAPGTGRYHTAGAMTPEHAAWVREHAWTNAHRSMENAYSGGHYNLCACQYGICGACDGSSDRGRPRHDRCASRSHGQPVIYPITWLTDHRCMVIGPPLWRADGPPCRWICPCPCPKTGQIQPPPRRRPDAEDAELPPRVPKRAESAQLGLFAEVS